MFRTSSLDKTLGELKFIIGFRMGPDNWISNESLQQKQKQANSVKIYSATIFGLKKKRKKVKRITNNSAIFCH